MLKVNATTVAFVIPYMVEISGKPGAISVLASGATNV